jgi:TrmH family RNA methyltransferase
MESEIITSAQNPRIKAVVRLRAHHGRAEQDLILIDGRREIGRALDADVRVQELFYCRRMLEPDDEPGLLQRAQRHEVGLVEVSAAVFAKVGYGERTEGLLAVAERPCRRLADLRLSDRPLIAVIEGVEKPGNLGAALRSADAAGVEAVIAADPATDIYGPNVIRSSLGTVFCVQLVAAPAPQTIAWLRERRMAIVTASPSGGATYTEVGLTGPVAVVFGSEARGLTQAWTGPDVRAATVPMLGRADSLNVSTAAALFFYEALRQRSGGRVQQKQLGV